MSPESSVARPPPKPLSAPQKAMHKLGLKRDIDLALHLPLRYEDETHITRLADAREGQWVQVQGVVTASEVTHRPRRQLLVTLDDGSDTVTLRFFSFYPQHQKTLSVGEHIRARGELRGGFMGWTLLHPAFRSADAPLPEGLTPIYPTSAQLPQAYLRKAVLGGLARADLSETLPADVLETLHAAVPGARGGLPTLREALQMLHHPRPDVPLAAFEDRSHPAWQRLKAEELLAQQLSQRRAQRERAALKAPALQAPRGGLPEQLLAVLPFGLTGAQNRVVAEIAADLALPSPMHRLLQGDVGSGKTVVAAMAAAVAIDCGWQCALMAPTEILAEQHFAKLIGWLEPLLAPMGKRVAWLTGSQKKKQREEMLALIASGEAALVVGTHAVIQAQVRFARLGLAIVDEQHRFGVAQRLALREKLTEDGEGLEPHLLMMSATPIPRTLAMSYYADLSVSTIDELPPGRTPVITKVVSESRRTEVIERIRAQVAEGRQVYWVCPLIEESEALDLSNATETHADLSQALNPHAPPPAEGTALAGVLVGLLHSRMPVAEKKAVMALFTAGDMGVLVSTTVIEVGVDVPNASLMVIEHAERFGLAQLHQLRGRVGRGTAESVCMLLYRPPLSANARERLRTMYETTDGFEIARRDLQLRGPGEFLGARQSGMALLRFADLERDAELVEAARDEAAAMLAGAPAVVDAHLARWLAGREEFLKA